MWLSIHMLYAIYIYIHIRERESIFKFDVDLLPKEAIVDTNV